MPLHVRAIAVKIAVISFFAVAIIGRTSGLTPLACSKRAMVGAIFAYIATVFAVKAVNAILINAMVEKQLERQKEKSGDSQN